MMMEINGLADNQQLDGKGYLNASVPTFVSRKS